MAKNRLFLSQATLDGWLADGKADLAGETLTMLSDNSRFRLKTALRFVAEIADGGDSEQLVGKVKDLDQLAALGGEHVSDSVILGDNAYTVVEGFTGEPEEDEIAVSVDVLSGSSLASAAAAAAGEGPPTGEIDLLARFFLQSR